MTPRAALSILVPVLPLLSSCIDTATVLDSADPGHAAPEEHAAEAAQAFARTPRTEVDVARAFDLMRKSAQATEAGRPERYERLALAAHYALWVARHGAETAARSEHADAAIVVCNTAIDEDPERVEGYYYRAIATGLFAQENTLYGPDAMGQIRTDARRAIELDASFEGAGPHRVLGGLYLEAPGPPSGVGSLRRALRELETAERLAPDHPDNALLLAKAYLDANRDLDRARTLVERLPALIEQNDDPSNRRLWQSQLMKLRERTRARLSARTAARRNTIVG